MGTRPHDYSSDLIYQWQSGALNESYADVWGETVDMINTRHNETPDTPRTEGTCSAFTRADVELVITAPADIAQTCDAAPASFGPVIGSPGFSDDVVVGAPVNGCTALTNAAAVAGKFVYIDRGTCTFDVKADNAEAAGATGIIVGNSNAGALISMSGSAGIPGLMITQEKGALIKAETDPIQATMQKANTDPTDNSYRWLSGETDPAFGGAIRDMWNPNCYGHPGKVSDVQYHCTTDDSGGVHRNSGCAQPRVRAAGGRWHLQRGHRARDRARQGRQPLVADAAGLPHAELGLRRHGRRPRCGVC